MVEPFQEFDTHDESSPFEMTISLSVLDDLGIRLYSNIPAVLSEVVANAWDADATEVIIEIDKNQGIIVITDNGHGMSKDDINRKYLTVGYRKRELEPPTTGRGRSPMGRKGIGKLSVFSIAKTLEVHSVKNGARNALRMNSDDIRGVIKREQGTYKPKPLDSHVIEIDRGTQIILSDLKNNVTEATDDFLRKRLARRFSIIGAHNEFLVKINDVEISAKDRDYYHLVQFMWYLGSESEEFVERCPNLEKSYVYDHDVSVGSRAFSIHGWIGTVLDSGKLDDDTNTIVVFANGKLVHEDVLKDLNETGVYASFVIGEIDANYVDLSEDEDIVTSNRQSLKQDEERYIALRHFVRGLLKRIQLNWTELRTQKGAERLLKEKGVQQWYGRLPGDQKKVAQKLLGRIDSLGLPDARSKREMVKATMLGFEKLALDQQLSVLENIETREQFDVLQAVIGNVSEIEKAHYYQIARGRVDIIRTFEKLIDEDQKEKVIQNHLYKYLWLLDPSWEMSTGTSRMEERVTTEFKKMETRLSPEEVKGRIDIRYRTITGTHVIVELKRYSVHVSAFELAEQVDRYKKALEKCLAEYFPNEFPSGMPVECICVVGRTPPQGAKTSSEVLQSVGAKFVTFDTLINRARQSYEGFLSAEKDISELISIINSVDQDFVE